MILFGLGCNNSRAPIKMGGGGDKIPYLFYITEIEMCKIIYYNMLSYILVTKIRDELRLPFSPAGAFFTVTYLE